MALEEMQNFVDKGVWGNVPYRYLRLYVGETDWETHVKEFYSRILMKRYGGDKDVALSQLQSALAFTILFPSSKSGFVIDQANPEGLLFGSVSVGFATAFNQQNWVEDLKAIVSQDIAIEQSRNELLSLGVIDPLEYSPYCREAFNRLYGKAEESGYLTVENKDALTRRFRNLVWAYGGLGVCSIFERHPEVLKKVVNWRTGYFFERVVYKLAGGVYTPDELVKIKKKELEKTNKTLIKKIRNEA